MPSKAKYSIKQSLPNYELKYKSQFSSQAEDPQSVQQLQQQNFALRKALQELDDDVDQMMQVLSQRIQKNLLESSKDKIYRQNTVSITNSKVRIGQKDRLRGRLNTDFVGQYNTIDYRKQIQKRELQNNETIIVLCKNEYNKLKMRQKFLNFQNLDEKKSHNNGRHESVSRKEIAKTDKQQYKEHKYKSSNKCREKLEQNISQIKEDINKIKKENVQLIFKNKLLGDQIIRTDDIVSYMRQLEEDVLFEEETKKRLMKKLQDIEKQITEKYKKLNQIRSESDMAQNYLLKKSREKLSEQKNSNNKYQDQLKRKQHQKQVAQKRKQTNIQRLKHIYHGALTQLDKVVTNFQQVDKNIKQKNQLLTRSKQEIKQLEEKLHKIKILRRHKINQAKIGLMLMSNELMQAQSIPNQSVIQLSPHRKDKTNSEQDLDHGKLNFNNLSNNILKVNTAKNVRQTASSDQLIGLQDSVLIQK